MSLLITSIVELSQKFFSHPVECNEYFSITNDYQKYCSNKNMLVRCSIGVFAKEAMLVHDIFFNLFAGSIKLLAGGIKGICAIPAGAFNVETDHPRCVKESIVHFGFSAFYSLDALISLLNINNTYPQDLLKRVESIFTNFLYIPNKGTIIQQVSDPQIEKELIEIKQKLEKIEEEVAQDLQDIDTLIGEVGNKMKLPSHCEKLVDQALKNPRTKVTLQKVSSLIHKEPSREESTKELQWSEEMQRIIHQHTQSIGNTSLKKPSIVDIDEDWINILEEPEIDPELHIQRATPIQEIQPLSLVHSLVIEENPNVLKNTPTNITRSKKPKDSPSNIVKHLESIQQKSTLLDNPLSSKEKLHRRQVYGKSLREKNAKACSVK
jgi:hypothetical protein